MNDAEFSRLADETLAAIEQAIEASGAPLDYENAGGLLTVLCEESDTQVIVSLQPGLQQIWVAAKSGGFHFSRDGSDWVCTVTRESLQALLSRVCSEQSKIAIRLDW